MARKRVVIITLSPSPYRVDLFCHLQEYYNEYEFFILFQNQTKRSWNVDLNCLEHPVFVKNKAITYTTSYDKKYFVLTYGVSKVLNGIHPDVIVASEYSQTVQSAFTWAQMHKVPFVSWTDGTLRSEKDFKTVRLLMRKRIIRKADSFIASSTSSRELQIRYGAAPERIHVSFLTVKTDAYKVPRMPKSDKVFRILFVGRLVAGKGIPLLLKAMEKVSGNYQLIIAGDGPERESLEKTVKASGLEEKVTFTGYLQREALVNLYGTSDVFVLPTLDDCFGLVILEAMCAGLPVITTIYADGAPDLIENGVSGIILDPNDTESFAAAIQRCIDDPAFAAEMGRKALERTEIFHFRNVSKGYMAAIEEALNRST